MADMLIKLYALPHRQIEIQHLGALDIIIRRPMAYEQNQVTQWIAACFNPMWAQECAAAFGQHPIGCYVAVHEGGLAGFCCVNCTFKNFVGPIGVVDPWRGQGVGRALLRSALDDLRHSGYMYAIVGDAGSPVFFEKAAGAVEIAGSKPGPYPPRLK